MPLVIDLSAVIPLALRDENPSYAHKVIDTLAETEGLVPSIFWLELLNGLATNVTKRGRLTAEDAREFVLAVEGLALQTAQVGPAEPILNLCFTHGLTAYDAAYLELAKRTGSTLATLDTALRRACEVEGVDVFSASG
jgi:predicted nucleic acid-binding protein